MSEMPKRIWASSHGTWLDHHNWPVYEQGYVRADIADAMLEALKKSLVVARMLSGIEEDLEWEMYLRASPRMQEIKQAIAQAAEAS